jgi:hypothetical protein
MISTNLKINIISTHPKEAPMVSLFALWLPILLSAVATFVISSVIHMVLKYHNSDFAKLPDEEKIMDALRPFQTPPGEYVYPHCTDNKERGSEAFKKRIAAGPVGFVTVLPNAEPGMGASLVQWFIYSVVVGIFAAYVARLSLPAGTEYQLVSRVTGAAAFMGYGLGLLQNSIWYKRSWAATGKSVFDALIYALFTGGVFGWLWPTGM